MSRLSVEDSELEGGEAIEMELSEGESRLGLRTCCGIGCGGWALDAVPRTLRLPNVREEDMSTRLLEASSEPQERAQLSRREHLEVERWSQERQLTCPLLARQSPSNGRDASAKLRRYANR